MSEVDVTDVDPIFDDAPSRKGATTRETLEQRVARLERLVKALVDAPSGQCSSVRAAVDEVDGP